MKKKLFVTVLTSAAICFGLSPIPGYAYPISPSSFISDSRIQPAPRFSYTENFALGLDFDGRTANCTLYISGKDSATSIDGKLQLLKKSSSGSYSAVKTWTISESSGDLWLTKSYTVSSSGDYRLSFTGKVYSGSAYDSLSNKVNQMCD